MEWTKLSGLRSTTWTLLLGALCMVGITSAFATVARFSAELRTLTTVQMAAIGIETGQLFVILLGALIITREYGSGSIRTSLAAVASRGRLMAAKAILLTGTTWGFGALIGVVSWTVAAVLLPRGPDAGPAEVARTVTAGATYLALIALATFGIGVTVRSAAATITLMVGLCIALPGVLAALPPEMATRTLPYLPVSAGETLITGPAPGVPYGPWAALAILGGWAATMLAVGYAMLRRRDA